MLQVNRVRNTVEKSQSTYTGAWGTNSYPCVSILLLPYIFIRHRWTWNNKHAGELPSIQASAYVASTVLDWWITINTYPAYILTKMLCFKCLQHWSHRALKSPLSIMSQINITLKDCEILKHKIPAELSQHWCYSCICMYCTPIHAQGAQFSPFCLPIWYAHKPPVPAGSSK